MGGANVSPRSSLAVAGRTARAPAAVRRRRARPSSSAFGRPRSSNSSSVRAMAAASTSGCCATSAVPRCGRSARLSSNPPRGGWPADTGRCVSAGPLGCQLLKTRVSDGLVAAFSAVYLTGSSLALTSRRASRPRRSLTAASATPPPVNVDETIVVEGRMWCSLPRVAVAAAIFIPLSVLVTFLAGGG